MLVPKSRSVDPTILMESLFKLSELENRIPLNMNVLSMGRVPKVMALNEVLLEWLDHRREVLQRRSRFRLAAIDRRLEILGGYLIAYLNLDEVIRIIREEDEPKPALMVRFTLTDLQARIAILDTRLRSLRKLEEMELRSANSNTLTKEKDGNRGRCSASDEDAMVGPSPSRSGAVKKTFGPRATKIGRPSHHCWRTRPTADREAISPPPWWRSEPITVIVSAKGWIRALKGHVADLSTRRSSRKR